jgi:hypothetical protein
MKDIDRASLFGFLEKMDRAAKSQQRICVIGAAALILLGQPARQPETSISGVLGASSWIPS